MTDTPIHIAIFARNEAANIERSMRTLLAGSPSSASIRLFVLINGCSDATPEIVRRFAAEHPQVEAIDLPIGDKCNAWNHYVHRVADATCPVHFFTDGDVLAAPGSIAGMVDALADAPHATVCAGLPLGGRNRVPMAELVRQRRWVFGNLYAVRYEQLARIREAGVRLPLGLCGNDHMITRLLKTRFPDITDFEETRVIWREGCGYVFDSLSPWRLRDVQIYLKRMTTYSLRTAQLKLVGEAPLDALPATMDAVNRQVLADLRRQSLRPWSPRAAARRRLQKWYAGDTDRYAPMLDRAA